MKGFSGNARNGSECQSQSWCFTIRWLARGSIWPWLVVQRPGFQKLLHKTFTYSTFTVSLCITMYHYVSLCITMYHYVSLCITMYHYVSLCITMYHYVSLCITMYHYVSLCITMYHYVSLCITMYHYVSLCITMYHYVSLCITMYHYVSLCITMYHYVSLCITMYHYVSLCITMYHYVSLCITMYHYVSLCITMYHYVSLCITMYHLSSCFCGTSICFDHFYVNVWFHTHPAALNAWPFCGNRSRCCGRTRRWKSSGCTTAVWSQPFDSQSGDPHVETQICELQKAKIGNKNLKQKKWSSTGSSLLRLLKMEVQLFGVASWAGSWSRRRPKHSMDSNSNYFGLYQPCLSTSNITCENIDLCIFM